ncbi:hypothetical protein [Saccharopolyspora cebuensis]|uniref:Uncharacterized protein n=1 Tax=Saccharopolyspora cebuensis TaxID=418759 RepID=A0ABV4CPJ6_9PSEU
MANPKLPPRNTKYPPGWWICRVIGFAIIPPGILLNLFDVPKSIIFLVIFCTGLIGVGLIVFTDRWAKRIHEAGEHRQGDSHPAASAVSSEDEPR